MATTAWRRSFSKGQPRFYVTANLYVPQTGKPPYPAVLQPVGHSLAAKNRAFYQNLSLGLVKSGFVVLTYDPLGQGERRIFYDPALEDSKVGSTTMEHQMVGIQSLLAGESIARYMIWDGMRGIDLLQSRPEVDARRIGVSGCSGGGTLTTYLAALDERVRVAAPSCYITDWEDQLQGTGPQDAEQQFPNQLAEGVTHADLVEAFAPKPYLICSTTEDFFPLAGARRTFEEARRIYALFGTQDSIAWFHTGGGHGTPQPTREAIYGWMKRWLQDAPPGPSPEPAFQTEYEQDLSVTPTGQVSTWLGGETASSLNIRRFSAIAEARQPLPPARVVDAVRRLTHYEASHNPLRIREREEIRREGYRLEPLTYETGPGRLVPALLALPDAGRSRQQCIVYVDALGKDAAARRGGDLDQLGQLGYTVLALDPSGIGETAANWSSYSTPWFGQDKAAWLALMVGRPLVGIRMDDILRGLDLLREKNLLYGGSCAAFGKGSAAVDLLHAAILEARISRLYLEDGLVSYESIARTPIHRRIFDSVVPGVLGEYDLTDLVAALAPRPVTLLNLRSPLGNTVLLQDARKAYRRAEEVYLGAQAAGKLTIGLRREEEPLAAAYLALR
ncbi:MAG TPA: acetylxylan esterase [Bryobacteraceae bacterium]|nr:acetylxylan esterase [Bryobacteraceae bacterium]